MKRAAFALALAFPLALAGCAGPEARVPPFARVPYRPISRRAVVAIALREWRLWGSLVDDAPPDTVPPPPPEESPERQPGLWQRVGEYWWLGMDAGNPDSRWAGKYDAAGHLFPAARGGDFAWSAAFVSYVMRIAGAGDRFPYSEAHATYIDIAAQQAEGRTQGWLVTAEAPDAYAPQPGDLICMGREWARGIVFADLPAPRFPSHCDIVTASPAPGAAGPVLTVVGGNVDDAVTMKHVPVTETGRLAGADGVVRDTRYPWMVVLRLDLPPIPGDEEPGALSPAPMRSPPPA
ncbi:MAG: DUF2272 domain-containing protein [Rhodospirillales bacterium]|nr:DUF2272 domain-containing protein [Rhodospirillales bacterium]